MDTTLRVKLRPDTHYAPVAKGVYWSRPGGRSFVLSGPATLFRLIDARLDLLTAGTSVDDLVGSFGDEAARPVFTHIVRTLLDQDILFDIGTAGPVPDEATALRYADVLGYLESRCAHPYQAFARLRGARITVIGAGTATGNLVRGLRDYGIDQIEQTAAPADAVAAATSDTTDGDREQGRAARPTVDAAVYVDDVDHRVDVTAAAERLDAGTPVLAVVAGARMAVIGPVLRDAADIDTFLATAARFADWLRADGAGAAPRPVSAAFAGSLAARTLLDELVGLTGDRYATVVHGGTLECQRVPLVGPPAESRWRDLDGADDVPEEATTDTTANPDATANPGATANPEVTGAPDGDLTTAADPDPIHQRAAWLTTRWTGIARWGDDLDLPQLPVALATIRDIAPPADAVAGTPARDLPMRTTTGGDRPVVLGWGVDRADAGIDALLALLRVAAREHLPAQPDWVAAAGTSARRFLTDGLLRLAAGTALQAPPTRELAVTDAGSWIGRSLWSVVTDYFTIPVRLWLREVPGMTWPLVTVTGESGDGDGGDALTHQWGPNLAAAVHAALAAVTAGCQLAEDPTSTATLDPMGTWAMRTASAAHLNRCHADLTALAAANGQKVTGRLLVTDPVGGTLPLHSGLVGLR